MLQFTFVPLCSSSLAKGRTPRTMSIPLLSTKMAAHLWGGPVRRSSHSSKPSTNHGRAVGKMYNFYVNFTQILQLNIFHTKEINTLYLATCFMETKVCILHKIDNFTSPPVKHISRQQRCHQ